MVEFAATRSPYYRRVLGDAGGRFDRVPVLTKALIRRHQDELFAEGVPEWRRIRRATSGSTGEPMVFFRDLSQGPIENQSARRFLLWLHGVSPDARMVWIAANPRLRTAQPRRPGWRGRLLGSPREDEFHGVTTVGLTPRILRREVRAWARYPRYWIYGHASIIDWIADHIETEGLVVGRPPDAIVTTSDQLTPLAEARIARVFGCPVHSWYGSHEFNGYVAGTLPGTRRYAVQSVPGLHRGARRGGTPGSAWPHRPVGPHRPQQLRLPIHPVSHGRRGGGLRRGIRRRVRSRGATRRQVVRAPGVPEWAHRERVTLGGYLTQTHDFGPLLRFFQCAQTGPNEVELRVVWARAPADAERVALSEAVRELTDPDTAIAIARATPVWKGVERPAAVRPARQRGAGGGQAGKLAPRARRPS
jgi:hypothetical protein